ncbi:hypothetical protein SNEBB_006997 [Seison nebaliae]|nr:hypothetical protein SNEBB_006997 [Seison nebaliae]
MIKQAKQLLRREIWCINIIVSCGLLTSLIVPIFSVLFYVQCDNVILLSINSFIQYSLIIPVILLVWLLIIISLLIYMRKLNRISLIGNIIFIFVCKCFVLYLLIIQSNYNVEFLRKYSYIAASDQGVANGIVWYRKNIFRINQNVQCQTKLNSRPKRLISLENFENGISTTLFPQTTTTTSIVIIDDNIPNLTTTSMIISTTTLTTTTTTTTISSSTTSTTTTFISTSSSTFPSTTASSVVDLLHMLTKEQKEFMTDVDISNERININAANVTYEKEKEITETIKSESIVIATELVDEEKVDVTESLQFDGWRNESVDTSKQSMKTATSESGIKLSDDTSAIPDYKTNTTTMINSINNNNSSFDNCQNCSTIEMIDNSTSFASIIQDKTIDVTSFSSINDNTTMEDANTFSLSMDHIIRERVDMINNLSTSSYSTIDNHSIHYNIDSLKKKRRNLTEIMSVTNRTVYKLLSHGGKCYCSSQFVIYHYIHIFHYVLLLILLIILLYVLYRYRKYERKSVGTFGENGSCDRQSCFQLFFNCIPNNVHLQKTSKIDSELISVETKNLMNSFHKELDFKKPKQFYGGNDSRTPIELKGSDTFGTLPSDNDYIQRNGTRQIAILTTEEVQQESTEHMYEESHNYAAPLAKEEDTDYSSPTSCTDVTSPLLKNLEEQNRKITKIKQESPRRELQTFGRPINNDTYQFYR